MQTTTDSDTNSSFESGANLLTSDCKHDKDEISNAEGFLSAREQITSSSESNNAPASDKHLDADGPPASDLAAETGHKKSAPKRAMILTGLPTPTLPPRPVFPSELEHYQVHGYGFNGRDEYNAQMQAYLSSLRQDYEKQLKNYETLKTLVHEDKYYMTVEIDQLDALDEDPFTLDTFENLMRMHANKGKDFILARVTTQDPNDATKHYYSYYGAHQINKVLFRTQPDEGLLHRMKARNPLNNMLVVGDVHYYIVSADDINAVKPLPTVHSSGSSVSSHSSRMSRCSKLAAQAIASQSTSARSSPILNSDISLFSRSSEIESPVSIIPPIMAMSIMKADAESCSFNRVATDDMAASALTQPRRKGSGSSISSNSSSSAFSPSSFLPCKPSRLRQAIGEDGGSQENGSAQNKGSAISMEPSDPIDIGLGDAGHAADNHHQYVPPQQVQSPLFQTLMEGRMRSRSNTVSSSHSNNSTSSATSAQSHQSHASKCSTATDVSNDAAAGRAAPSPCLASSSSSSSRGTRQGGNKVPGATYHFRYFASDDDFLLRSVIRQVFKQNALETWDAILFTISNIALREYTNQAGGDPVLLPLQQQQQQQNPVPQSESLDDSGRQSGSNVDSRQAQTPSLAPQIQIESPISDSGSSLSGPAATELSQREPTPTVSSDSEVTRAPGTASNGDDSAAHERPNTSSMDTRSSQSLPCASALSSHAVSHPPSRSTAPTTMTTAGSLNSGVWGMLDSGHSSTVSLPSVDSAAGVGGERALLNHEALSNHSFKCHLWLEDVKSQQEGLREFDAQLLENTKHIAVARFSKDLFEPVELRLEGGEKMFGLLLVGGAKRLGDGSIAYVRPLRHRMDDEIDDLELKLALKAHAFSQLVDVKNYEPQPLTLHISLKAF
ncbi:hypothetical protein KVV02_008840 [Mortierella alpina]|uniref:Uncharacterized protein n=1 Tax=Mortierella alpina TaxID=64518 RepID=A0A9P8D1F8_MORAP|nr:hypothetical protein KVV02_008840 [Mortierella alpina]